MTGRIAALARTEDRIAAVAETISLRGRHLEGAVLIGANLRKAERATG